MILQIASLATSSLMRIILDAMDISINSDSVYICRPPWMELSTVYSIVKALPAFWGFAYKAESTCDCYSLLRASAEMIVIFSSLLNCW